MPAASRLFLRMENKAYSWECGNGQTRREEVLPGVGHGMRNAGRSALGAYHTQRPF